jgi:WD40 repeat protein
MRTLAVLVVFLTAAQAQAAAPYAEPLRDRDGHALPDGAYARLGSMRFRVAPDSPPPLLSPDGKFVLVDQRDRLLVLDAVTGRTTWRMPKENQFATAVWSPDGGVWVPEDFALCRWDVSGKPRRKIAWGTGSAELFFSGDGKTVAGWRGFQDRNEVEVLDVATFNLIKLLKLDRSWKSSCAVSADGKTLASWCDREKISDEAQLTKSDREKISTVVLWNVSDATVIDRVVPDGAPIRGVTFSPCGKQLAAMTAEGAVRVYGLPGCKPLHTFSSKDGRLLTFSPDGKLLAAADKTGEVRVWDLAKGRQLKAAKAPAGECCSMVFHGKDKLRGCSRDGNVLVVWEVLGDERRASEVGARVGVQALAFTGRSELTCLSAWGEVISWDLSGKVLRKREVWPIDHGSKDWLNHQELWTLSPDGKYAAASEGERRRVVLREVATGRVTARPKGEGLTYSHLAFSPDGKTLAAVAFRKKEGIDVSLWSAETGKRLPDLPAPAAKVRQDDVRASWSNRSATVAFAPDGKRLAVCWCGLDKAKEEALVEIQLYDLKTKKPAKGSPITNPWSYRFNPNLVFAPDGGSLTLSDDNGILADRPHEHRWFYYGQPKDFGHAVRWSPTPPPVYSPDGRTVAAVIDREKRYDQRSVTVWEVSTGQQRAQFDTDGQISALAFSGDGRTVAAGLQDGSILLFGVNDHGIAKAKGGPVEKGERQRLWCQLAAEDGAKAYRAMRRLASSPTTTSALLREHVRPAEGKALTEKELRRLVKELDDEDFDVREKAEAKLKKQGWHAEAAMLEAIQGKPSAEQRQRLEKLFDAANEWRLGPEERRLARLFEVLHWQGGDRALLEKLAAGRADDAVTLAAKDALRRLPPPARR